MSEIYVNITGYPKYQISNFGNVKNVKTGRILKPSTNPQGYFMVVLTNTCSPRLIGGTCNYKKRTNRLVAFLVLLDAL